MQTDLNYSDQVKLLKWFDTCPVQYMRRVNLQGEVCYLFFNHKKEDKDA
jgi:hypothetical protein